MHRGNSVVSAAQKSVRNPASEFSDPQQVVDEPLLSVEQKIAILESWKLDLIEMQRAEEENMAGAASGTEANARTLTEVTRAIHALRAA